MNIFDYAMEMEQDGEQFYREIAEKTPDEGLRTIFTVLADDEVKHYNIFQQLRADSSATPEMVETRVLNNAKNIFQEMRDSRQEVFDLGESQEKMYRTAMEIEARSRDFYEEKAAELPDGPQKSLLLRIAEEEKKHYFLLDHLIQFVSRPHTWIEDAEFNHMDEY